MKKTAVTLALLAGLLGTSGCGNEKSVEEFRKQEHVLTVGEKVTCNNGSHNFVDQGFRYAGMPNEETFAIIPSNSRKESNLYFPVSAETIGDSIKVLEVTPEYMKMKCE
ncbi:hypothetical protein HOE37_04775 [Candidatus Woesearchaeota archaeon]|jgi:hypothetical protein|nr:hypothetical protein [Candidatus Woesearchaeota archaeon]MBT4336507.1 hypothetical protein [Candidatus Woesearchaeota archaeon]MBT4469395.1 hypothetical protein [Candidatus Woesearchaeota archaeon]MBT6744210.1 hypothetical protein [Candidatus Woesearchaeota archaeon]